MQVMRQFLVAAGCIRSVLEDLNVFDQIPRVKLETSRIIEVSPYTVPQYYNDLMALGLSMYGSVFWAERELHSAGLSQHSLFHLSQRMPLAPCFRLHLPGSAIL